MAKILGTAGISNSIEQIIKNAEKSIWLISPYIQFNERIKELIILKNMRGITTCIVYGKEEPNKKEIEWVTKLKNVKLRFKENLHAKCYMNEKKCIISSMNLYEFSEKNNTELGIEISKENDEKLFKETHQEVQIIILNSEDKKKENSKPKCKCGIEMIRKDGTKGKTDFWGCSKFGKRGCGKMIPIH